MKPFKSNQSDTDQPCSADSGRRQFLKAAVTTAAACGTIALTGCGPDSRFGLKWQEYFKKNYRLMSDKEKLATVDRLERLARIDRSIDVQIGTDGPPNNVLFGYAFNLTRCEGFMECVQACVKENNLDRRSKTQYVRIFEMAPGQMTPESGNGKYFHEVPVDQRFYMGVQCFHCQNAPCVKACPTKATWMEPDGIVVVDYDWCIGCRYCMAACPYWGRRFNWNEPVIPKEDITRRQHYLGNRLRTRGMMEKCTFCIQRSRNGKLPACAAACPTGARIFGNLLDPDSEIRFVLKHKKVFRLKEDLGTDPKFWFFID